MKALRKRELFKLLDDEYPGDDMTIFEDELQDLLKKYEHDWFINEETKKWEQYS